MKAILVLDEMPSSCKECNLQQFYICKPVGKSVVGTPTDLKSKPDWCPLKPMPKEKELKNIKRGYNTYSNTEFWEAVGYNACIDEILGGSESE